MSDTVDLQKIHIALEAKISKDLLLDQKLKVVDKLDEMITASIHGFIYGECNEKKQIEYPSDWWEAFKERWFFGFMLKRWPVKYTVHQLDIMTLYPEYKPSLPKMEWVGKVFSSTGDAYFEAKKDLPE